MDRFQYPYFLILVEGFVVVKKKKKKLLVLFSGNNIKAKIYIYRERERDIYFLKHIA
jgi:hypothetical protein